MPLEYLLTGRGRSVLEEGRGAIGFQIKKATISAFVFHHSRKMQFSLTPLQLQVQNIMVAILDQRSLSTLFPACGRTRDPKYLCCFKFKKRILYEDYLLWL
jgi:hypothetical protein